MIQVQDIHHSFGTLEVLKGISFEVHDSEILSIIGKSGAGKTTLLQCIGTLLKPTSGKVVINGTDVFALHDRQLSQFRLHNIGFIFQFHQLLPEFTALENVVMPALIANENFHDAEKRAKKLLEDLQMSHRINHKPQELSGGEKQRVAACRAMMMQPSLILADEPSGSLDMQNKQELHRLLLDMRERYGHTIIIVTHDEQLSRISDRTIELEDGHIK